MTHAIPHTTDADCAGTIDPATDCCIICGVDHSGECADCHGRGFHRFDCPEVADEEPVCERCGKPASQMEDISYAPFCSLACDRAALDARYAAADAAYTAAYRAAGRGDRASWERLDAARAALDAVTREVVAEESARYPNGVPGGTWGT